MKSMVQIVASAWHIAGLVLLFDFGHWVWGIFGIFIPVIPYVYTIILLVDWVVHP